MLDYYECKEKRKRYVSLMDAKKKETVSMLVS